MCSLGVTLCTAPACCLLGHLVQHPRACRHHPHTSTPHIHVFSLYRALQHLHFRADFSKFIPALRQIPQRIRRSCSDVLLHGLGLVSIAGQALEAALALGLVGLHNASKVTSHHITSMPCMRCIFQRSAWNPECADMGLCTGLSTGCRGHLQRREHAVLLAR